MGERKKLDTEIRLEAWQSLGGSGRWGIGVAVDVLDLEDDMKAVKARLAALEANAVAPGQFHDRRAAVGFSGRGHAIPPEVGEWGVIRESFDATGIVFSFDGKWVEGVGGSGGQHPEPQAVTYAGGGQSVTESSRPVQPATETAAAGANDPERDNTPAITAEDREAIMFCVSCAQDYRDGLDTCDHKGRERWDRATKMIQAAANLALRGEPQTLPTRETWPPHIRPRDEQADEPAAMSCGCAAWARPFTNGGHHPRCEHAHAEAREIVQQLVEGIRVWARDEDGTVHEQCYDAWKRAVRWLSPTEGSVQRPSSPSLDAENVPAASNWPGKGYRWVLHGEAWEEGDERCVGENHHTGVHEWEKITGPLSVCMRSTSVRRRLTPAEAVPDDAGRRMVAGEPMNAAEMRHALGVAREEIVRLVSDVAMLTAQRDTARDDVERHRMTEKERESVKEGIWACEDITYGRGANQAEADTLRKYLNRTREVE
jgi:hypothetical protein